MRSPDGEHFAFRWAARSAWRGLRKMGRPKLLNAAISCLPSEAVSKVSLRVMLSLWRSRGDGMVSEWRRR